MNELALFAGGGGGILAGHLLGWRTVCAVEIEDYPRRVLLQRQADGFLPRFPIWDDVCTFDGRPWRGRVDVISGGFPCQDISAAGKGKGITGERSGLWKEMARIIGEVRPRYAFVENSPMLATRGLERVLADLTAMGYDSRWGVISAADIGANHKRERIWIVANTKHCGHTDSISKVNDQKAEVPGEHRQERCGSWLPVGASGMVRDRSASGLHNQGLMADTDSEYVQGQQFSGDTQERPRQIMAKPALCGGASNRHWWKTEPNVGRVADGVANRVDRLKAIGNGQVPLCAATAWRILK
jgi:DNA (cytosine-5)-methyltransferase 1